ncbi:hypothetical protein BC939DRAFT_444715 [Gamsiella multidivaricata]|uniref:uncharacterized protein n=1 Tax=Gamsiella multidivaricata TaxID=101098 RepID=UPI00221FC676|nr:uncharacterized protein BC939DRAFT_444715 [Gamsiella multidivaricata]KAI7827592.1 hypothetical protein BC939DRAFT_444715 [Gamsiella multidivaricata]
MPGTLVQKKKKEKENKRCARKTLHGSARSHGLHGWHAIGDWLVECVGWLLMDRQKNDSCFLFCLVRTTTTTTATTTTVPHFYASTQLGLNTTTPAYYEGHSFLSKQGRPCRFLLLPRSVCSSFRGREGTIVRCWCKQKEGGGQPMLYEGVYGLYLIFSNTY